MTDERQPDDPQAPAPPPPAGSDPAPPTDEPSMHAAADEPTAPPPADEPPALAPLAEQARSASPDQLDETAPQPTAGWTAPASTHVPPPIPPPAYQPSAGWAPPPPPVAVAGQRTALPMGAGILLVILGFLGGLLGLAVAVLGRAIIQSIRDFDRIPELEGLDTETFLSGVVVFIGIIVIVYSLMYLFAGIGVLRSRSWGRVLGIIVGVLSGMLWLGGLGGARRAAGPDDLGFVVIALAIHVYIVVALLFFWRSKPTPG